MNRQIVHQIGRSLAATTRNPTSTAGASIRHDDIVAVIDADYKAIPTITCG